MKRKMLISMALVIIMLLNCIMPVLVSNAGTTGEEIQLNSKLYFAVKASLTAQKIQYSADDITHTITISAANLANVKRLNLKEGGISDLTDIGKFTFVEHLDLSGNNLSEESNLAALNDLKNLNYLDLSTNKIGDISKIEEIISSIEAKADGKVVLSGQTVTQVSEAIINEEEDSSNEETMEIIMPQILEKAGFIKAHWMKEGTYYESEESRKVGVPQLEEMCNPVTPTNNKLTVRIANDKGQGYYGLYALEIYIYDDATEAASAANLNPAATNPLNGSRFYIYVCVHGSTTTAVNTPDTNLYNAIKEQLTAGQEINSELESYPYSTDAAGETIYESCIYAPCKVDNGTEKGEYYVLTPEGYVTPQYIWDKTTGYVYEIESQRTETNDETGEEETIYTIGELYSDKATLENAESVDEFGVVTTRKVVRFPHNGENRNLYVRAYDVAKIFVISNEDLYNKITSLILNNREIRDLTGIEKFVGLKSYLNVSHNYLDNIDPIYDLQANKEEKEDVLRTNFKKWFSEREYGNLKDSYDTTQKAKEDIDKDLESLSKELKDLYKKVQEASEIKSTKDDGSANEQFAEQCKKKAEEINKILDRIKGYTEVNEATGSSRYVEGIMDNIEKHLATLNTNVVDVYGYLQILYRIYNSDYRLATLLTDELNYLNIEEYETLQDTYKSSKDNVEDLFEDQVKKLENLDKAEALSKLDRDLLREAFGVPYPTDTEPEPVKERFDELLKNNAYNRVQFVEMCNTMREIGLLSEITNYCLMKRMNQETATIQCYAEDYLKARIEEFSYEGIDVTLEQKVLDNLQNNVAEDPEDELYNVFYNWIHFTETVDSTTGETTSTGAYVYGSLLVPRCQGEYKLFDYLDLIHENVTTAEQLAGKAGITGSEEGYVKTMESVKSFSLPTLCKLVEYYEGQQGDVQLYTELMAFAGKMIENEKAMDRYITLPDLKKLDISYNAYLTGVERLGELTGLRELYAGYDYITDLSETDWEALRYLRVLDFSYNYIRSITPLEVLDHLQKLDVSHNLLSGALNYNFTNVRNTLKEIDLSYNQLEDITTLLEYIDLKSWGNDGNYLAREDTLNVDLSYQTINMEVKDPVYLSEYPETVDVELPKIFTQLLAIDVNRTGLGLQSSEGRIESEGKYVTLVTKTPGEKVGTVVVLPMNGGGLQPETCIGNGTKAVIKYQVAQRTVDEITISPELISMDKGGTQQFTAEITGENLKDTSVTWSIEGNASESTTIDENGLLTIGADETAATIKVIVTSNFDTSMTDYTTVTVNGNEAPNPPEDGELAVTVSPESCNVKVGETKVFTAVVTGENVTDRTVTWTVTGNNSANTKIANDGTLTVGADETATTLTVTATSNADNTKSDTATVSVKPETYNENQNIQVSVTPNSATVQPGKTQKFVATVTGDNVTDNTVTWSVTGNKSANTKIANDGTLTVGADETAKTLTVTARSNADGEKVKTVTVSVPGSSTDYPQIRLGYETEDEFLKEIKPKTPVSDFKTVLIGNQPYNVVVKKDGKTITSGNMTTGMYVQIQDQNGEVVHQGPNSLYVYEVVVKGDVNSDGVANSLDSVAIKAHRNEVKGAMLTGSAFEAADINDDGAITPIDSKLLLYHRAEVKGYVLDYVK